MSPGAVLASRPRVASVPGPPPALRPARAADAATLARIGGRGFLLGHAGAAPRDQLRRRAARSFTEARFRRDAADPDVCLLVAETREVVCGFVRVAVRPAPAAVVARPAVALDQLYLDAAAIGRGVGSALVAGALESATSDGFPHVWLRVWTGNAPAIRCYRRWGFAGIAVEAVRVEETDVETLIMGREP